MDRAPCQRQVRRPAPPSAAARVWASLALVVAWAIPAFLVHSSIATFDRSLADQRQAASRQRLGEARRLVEHAFEARWQIECHLARQVFTLIGEAAGRPDPIRFLADGCASRLGSPSRTIPPLRWHVLSFTSAAEATARAAELAPPLQFHGGSGPDLHRLDLFELFQYFRCDVSGAKFEGYYDMTAELTPRLGMGSLAPVVDTIGRFIDLEPKGRPLGVLWVPILDEDLEGRSEADMVLLPRMPAGPRRRQSLRGAILLVVSPEALTVDLGMHCLLQGMGEKGILLEVTAGEGAARRSWKHPALAGAGADPGEGPMDRRLAGYACQQITVVQDGVYQVLLALPEPPAATDGSLLRRAGNVGILAWMAVGVGIIWFRWSTGRSGWLPLAWQLGGTLLAMLLPPLLIGSMAVECSFSQRQAGLPGEVEGRLRDAFAAIDQTRPLILGWNMAMTRLLIDRSDLLATLAKIDARKGGDRKRLGDLLIAWFNRRAAERGLLMKDPLFGSRSINPVGFRSSQEEALTLIFKGSAYQGARVLRALDRDDRTLPEGPQNEEMMLGIGLDEVDGVFKSSISPTVRTAMAQAPEEVAEFRLLDTNTFLATCLLPRHGTPRFVFKSKFDSEVLDFHTARLWSEGRDSPGGRWGSPGRRPGPVDTTAAAGLSQVAGREHRLAPRFFLSPIELSGWAQQDPYWVPETSREEAFETSLLVQRDVHPFWLLPLVQEAGRQVSPQTTIEGDGAAARLWMAYAGTGMPNRILVGYAPLGEAIATERGAQEGRRWLLVALLLGTLGLAIQVGRRFLSPILSLSAAAGRVMREDYAVRLPPASGEFGQLAEAFNEMVRGVAEGRLLSRFVSESVRGAARDEEQERAAREGEAVEAVILFAGLGRFKDLLAAVPPDVLVVGLNRHLEGMAEAIRGQEGEIDKFIGDKVLAVFPARGPGGREAAAGRALRAALDLRRRAREADVFPDNPLGVGMSFGPVLSGIMGAATVRLELTVIGDTVNLASRLGDLAARLGAGGRLDGPAGPTGGIVVEAGLAGLLRGALPTGAALLPLPLPPIKGMSRPIDTFLVREPPGEDGR